MKKKALETVLEAETDLEIYVTFMNIFFVLLITKLVLFIKIRVTGLVALQ